MKQVVVLSAKAHQNQLSRIFEGLNIPVFSKIDIEGIKNENQKIDVSNWFGSGKESDFSVMYFAYLEDAEAIKIIESIDSWKEKNEGYSSMHAYVSPVEMNV
ncbi:MAG: hypothetical protein JXQ96_08860 [Cyclobacteriaceae bacterium]